MNRPHDRHPAHARSADPNALQLASRNDEPASRVLLALVPRVRGWLRRMLGPGAALDDATQEALIAIAQALPQFEGRSSLETFAHRITVRTAYRHFKRKGPELGLDVERCASAYPVPEAELAERQGLECLYRCIAKLPEKRRTAFVLCAIEGLTPQEAADVVGTSPGSMRSRFMHARDELARMLGNEKSRGSR